jgi:hypothetical protein
LQAVIEDKYASLTDELTAKLKQQTQRAKHAEQEIRDLNEEFQNQKEELRSFEILFAESHCTDAFWHFESVYSVIFVLRRVRTNYC